MLSVTTEQQAKQKSRHLSQLNSYDTNIRKHYIVRYNQLLFTHIVLNYLRLLSVSSFQTSTNGVFDSFVAYFLLSKIKTENLYKLHSLRAIRNIVR